MDHAETIKAEKVWKWKSLSRVWVFGTRWTVLSWNSPGQNTGVGSLSLLRGSFQPRSPTLQADSLPAKPPLNSSTKIGSTSVCFQILKNGRGQILSKYYFMKDYTEMQEMTSENSWVIWSDYFIEFREDRCF